MYEVRLELENPGGLYGSITVDDLGKASADTRDPYMEGALLIIIDKENRFSGIPIVRAELRKAGMPDPIFRLIEPFTSICYCINRGEI